MSVPIKKPNGKPLKTLKKHVATVHASSELTLIERKIINILLLNAFERIPDEHQYEFSISQKALCAMLGWDASNNSPALRKALKNIVGAPMEFNLMDDDDGAVIEWAAVSPLASAKLHDGVCTYSYAPELKRKLANPEIYALVNMNVQRQFERTYSLSLYENCIRYRKVGSTGWHSVEKWRRLLGTVKYDKSGNPIPSVYDSFKAFKAKVLKPAMDEIARVSNIIVALDMRKVGREIKELRFDIIDNPQYSFLHDSPETDGIRETEAYKALAATGFENGLIVAVIESQGEEYALDLAAYVQKPGTNNPGGLARSLYDKKAAIPPRKSEVLQPAPLPLPMPVEPVGKKTADKYTPEEKAELRKVYAAEKGARLTASGTFADANHIGEFNTWLIARG